MTTTRFSDIPDSSLNFPDPDFQFQGNFRPQKSEKSDGIMKNRSIYHNTITFPL